MHSASLLPAVTLFVSWRQGAEQSWHVADFAEASLSPLSRVPVHCGWMRNSGRRDASISASVPIRNPGTKVSLRRPPRPCGAPLPFRVTNVRWRSSDVKQRSTSGGPVECGKPGPRHFYGGAARRLDGPSRRNPVYVGESSVLLAQAGRLGGGSGVNRRAASRRLIVSTSLAA